MYSQEIMAGCLHCIFALQQQQKHAMAAMNTKNIDFLFTLTNTPLSDLLG